MRPLTKTKETTSYILLAARIPEFNWDLERNLFGDIKLVQNIKCLFANEYSFSVAYVGKDEIRVHPKVSGLHKPINKK